jgi:hypothetical protein
MMFEFYFEIKLNSHKINSFGFDFEIKLNFHKINSFGFYFEIKANFHKINSVLSSINQLICMAIQSSSNTLKKIEINQCKCHG